MKQIILTLIVLVLVVPAALAQDDDTTQTWDGQFYAPYVYAGSYPLAYISEQSGVRYFSLAFMLNGQEVCQAAWGGGKPVATEKLIMPDIEKLREIGGDVMVSFGGAGGDELAKVCPDVESLTEQYQLVIDTYRLTRLDFDIEGDEIHEGDTVEMRSQAIVALQASAAAEDRPLYIAFTLPVLPEGLTQEGIAVLQSAIDNGVDIDVVNIMTMDYGSDYPADKMGELTIQAADSLFVQLTDLYPEKDETELWSMIGLTPMIGLNDTMPQTFTLEDAEMVVNYALEKGIRQLAMWSLNRDKACGGNAATLTDSCSGITQEQYAFSSLLSRIAPHDDE